MLSAQREETGAGLGTVRELTNVSATIRKSQRSMAMLLAKQPPTPVQRSVGLGPSTVAM
jgi:hypothetical protein